MLEIDYALVRTDDDLGLVLAGYLQKRQGKVAVRECPHRPTCCAGTGGPPVFHICLLALALTADPNPRLDADGFPLPTEAVQRYGSLRFLVNNLKAAAFSPDGKVVYTISERRIPTTGGSSKPVPRSDRLGGADRERSCGGRGIDKPIRTRGAADPDGKSVWVLERVGDPKLGEDPEFQRVRYSTADGKGIRGRPACKSGVRSPCTRPAGWPTSHLATTSRSRRYG